MTCCRCCWSTVTWPGSGDRSKAGIEATAFRRLPAAVWEGLAAEAAELKALLADREPLVFGRYGHWWKTIDGVQVKVL